MNERKAYFPQREGDPDPLSICVERRVRFEEVDALGVVWHGRYASYFEDARVVLGDSYGVGYFDFVKHSIVVPIKQMHMDYHLPLHYGEIMEIEARMHWTQAARVNCSFTIRNHEGKIATTGYTVQLMLDPNFNLLITPPPFYEEFNRRWKAGRLSREEV